MNLTTWSGPGDGYILVGYMQEVDIATGECFCRVPGVVASIWGNTRVEHC